MKIKMNTEFISFNDGVCNIYSEDEVGERMEANKYDNICFSNRILGFKRYFEANANQIDINRVIRIPHVEGINSYDYVEIGTTKYGIKLVQEIYDTNPPSIDLTLDKAR